LHVLERLAHDNGEILQRKAEGAVGGARHRVLGARLDGIADAGADGRGAERDELQASTARCNGGDRGERENTSITHIPGRRKSSAPEPARGERTSGTTNRDDEGGTVDDGAAWTSGCVLLPAPITERGG